jgi:single-strand DNA-binding protein
MNKVILIGNLTRAPELNTTQSGVNVAKFSLAVNRGYKAKDGTQPVDFINIVAWRELGDRCAQYLSKGKKACVEGELNIRQYEDKNGETRYVTEIIAHNVEFLTPKGDDGYRSDYSAPPERSAPPKKKVSELEPLDDTENLPF